MIPTTPDEIRFSIGFHHGVSRAFVSVVPSRTILWISLVGAFLGCLSYYYYSHSVDVARRLNSNDRLTKNQVTTNKNLVSPRKNPNNSPHYDVATERTSTPTAQQQQHRGVVTGSGSSATTARGVMSSSLLWPTSRSSVGSRDMTRLRSRTDSFASQDNGALFFSSVSNALLGGSSGGHSRTTTAARQRRSIVQDYWGSTLLGLDKQQQRYRSLSNPHNHNGSIATNSNNNDNWDNFQDFDQYEAQELFWQLVEHEELELSMKEQQQQQLRNKRQKKKRHFQLERETAVGTEEQEATTALSRNSNSRRDTETSLAMHHGPKNSLAWLRDAFHLRGPMVQSIDYATVTPPSWHEISRNLIMTDSAWELSRTVSLHLSKTAATTSNSISRNLGPVTDGSPLSSVASPHVEKLGTAVLVIGKPLHAEHPFTNNSSSHSKKLHNFTKNGTFMRPVTDCSIHIQPPSEGGVLKIYTTAAACATLAKQGNLVGNNMISSSNNNSGSFDLEHTFASAAEAAQFQLDLLALQISGRIIHNMYQALCLIHQGSATFVGNDPVLHFQSVGEQSDHHDKTDIAGTKNDSPKGLAKDCQSSDDECVTVLDSGIAWDDVMRCLGCSFPSIRIRLEVMWYLEIHGSLSPASSKSTSKSKVRNGGMGENDSAGVLANAASQTNIHDASSLLDPIYSNKRRLLLGPVDFFRLFLPQLPETAIPESESSRYRAEQMLRLRKRVARASVLVQAYTRARTVANRGWNLGATLRLPDDYWKRRAAFDVEIDNMHHDFTAKNEYYEATVSRDVSCCVRGANCFVPDKWWKFGKTESPAVMSSYQAFTLVGLHAFHWPCDDEELPLHYRRDPVKSVPSLRALIEDNPDLQFFVFVFFPAALHAAIVHVYVRSLPRSIDPKFDTVVSHPSPRQLMVKSIPYILSTKICFQLGRFLDSDEDFRRKRLEVVTQLGINKDGLSFIGRCLFWWLSFLLRATQRKNVGIPLPAKSNDRTSVPALNLSECGATFHFGGKLQTDRQLPGNYFASTVHMESRRNNNFVTRMMLSYFEYGGLSTYATDFTFIISGENDDELPERALCTSRIVRSTTTTLPLSYGTTVSGTSVTEVQVVSSQKKESRGIGSLYWKIFVLDPLVVAVETVSKTFQKKSDTRNGLNRDSDSDAVHAASCGGSPKDSLCSEQAIVDNLAHQPFDKAVNELIRILEEVAIPIRVNDSSKSSGFDHTFTSTSQTTEFAQVSILRTLTRYDIERYFIASNCSLKLTAVALIESAAWRGTTFPIDTRACRIELQSGQFFQQGRDLDGHPVFYFRNMCLGPWRKDENAVVAAVLHRLESNLLKLSAENPRVQCTLIVLAGKPYNWKQMTERSESTNDKTEHAEQATAASTQGEGDGEISENDSADAENESLDEATAKINMSNPRIDRDEVWNVHTTKTMISSLVNLLLTHYPERLNKALVVIGHGNKKYIRSSLGGVLSLSSLVQPSRTRDKIRFLTSYNDLQIYIDRSQLVTLAGGTQLQDNRHYDSNDF